jgi:excisionase family DNA binding protein
LCHNDTKTEYCSDEEAKTMLVSITVAAKELGVSTEHIRRMIRAGKWPVYSLGPKATRIDPEEIKALGRLIAKAE